ncbi:hypothetical protein GCM10017673_38980 [Streptosporangium violaceochromogenes]|nr:hypothetical protein GCM10017673_38980 [Streptosporangium violaceochromogenes]
MHDATTHDDIADKVRALRLGQGWTQEDLAHHAGLSARVVQKIEQGGTARMETYHALARALGVVTVTFVAAGPPEPVLDGPNESVLAPIRAAVAPPVGLGGTPLYSADDGDLSLPRLERAMDTLESIYHSNRYDELAPLLPPLLVSAQHHVARLDEGAGQAGALRLRARASNLAGRYLIQVRAHDLALATIQSSQRDALTIGDMSLVSAAVSFQAWAMMRQGRFREVVDLCLHAADALEPRMSRATPEELSAWGRLMSRASAAAARDNRPDDAEEYASLAVMAGDRIGRERRSSDATYTFGPLTAALGRAENAAVAEEPGRVVELFQRLPRGAGRTDSSTWNRALLDAARAHARIGDVPRAVEIMTGLRRKAPEWLRYQQLGLDTTREIVSRAKRKLTTDQRELVRFFSLTD